MYHQESCRLVIKTSRQVFDHTHRSLVPCCLLFFSLVLHPSSTMFPQLHIFLLSSFVNKNSRRAELNYPTSDQQLPLRLSRSSLVLSLLVHQIHCESKSLTCKASSILGYPTAPYVPSYVPAIIAWCELAWTLLPSYLVEPFVIFKFP